MAIEYLDTDKPKIEYLDEGDGPSALHQFRESISPFNVAKNVATSIYNDPRGALQTTADAMRAGVNALTFGMNDRLAGISRGTGTDAQVKLSEEARQRSPTASLVGDVAGSIAVPAVGAEALAARAATRVAPWLARATGYGVSGAGTGAAQGAGNTYTGEVSDYAKNALMGGVFGGLAGGAGGAIFGRRPATTTARAPTANDLYHAKNADYANLERVPVDYDARFLANRADDLEHGMLTGAGGQGRYHWRDSPTTWAGLDEMRQPAQAAARFGPTAVPYVDPAGIEFVRKGLNKIPKTPERATDRESAGIVKRALDDFVINPPPGAVIPGNERQARIAGILAQRARDNYGAFKRVQGLDEVVHNARNTTGATHSGLNEENELRKHVRTLTKLKDGTSQAIKKGYNASERELLDQFAQGTRLGNLVRWGGKTLGGGSGLGFLAAGGAGTGIANQYFDGSPGWSASLMLGMPAAGLALRGAGNRMARNNIQRLQETIAQRSPLYRDRVQLAPMQQGGAPLAARAVRDAMALGLLKQQGGADE